MGMKRSFRGLERGSMMVLINKSLQRRGLHALQLIPDTKVSSRTEIFEQDDNSSVYNDDDDDKVLREQGAQQMDRLMKNLLMPDNDDDTNEVQSQDDGQQQEEDNNTMQEEFTFRLFSSQPATQVVSISEKDETTDKLAEAAAAEWKRQQLEEFDDNDPDFRARVSAAAITFEQIMQQSQTPYPAMRYPRRVLHIPRDDGGQQGEKEKVQKRRRKSKKRRDFEKAVKEGRITLKPNMRDLNTPGGWPGWPGRRNPCAIIKPKNQQRPRAAAIGKGFQQRKNFKPAAKRGGRV